MSNRKRYTPLPDARLDTLRDQAKKYFGTSAHFSISAEALYNLASEVIDLREEIFRLSLCETVEDILAEELGHETDDDPRHIVWREGQFLHGGGRGNGRRLDETSEIPRPPDSPPFPSTYEGRRLPPFED